MAYVIGERVKSRRWARFYKSKATALCLILAFCLVFSMSTNSNLIYGIKSLSSKAMGQQAQANGPKKPNQKNKKTATSTSTPKASTPSASLDPKTDQCFLSKSEFSNFQKSISPEIRKLAEYEKVCAGQFISGSMLFTNMPSNPSEAKSLASDTAIRLKEFAKYGLAPYLILEPITSSGFIDFKAYANGSYDETMSIYFDNLRAQGINDQVLGTLVSFPESNIPEWGNVNPTDVASCISRTASLQKQYFPTSKASVLLDSKSYPRSDSWEGGAYASLLPYVSKIPKNLIDSFGLQGYPWPDPQPEYKPESFLSASVAIEAAMALGAKDIWLSSGTFATGKAWNGQTYYLSPSQRGEILSAILNQAKLVQQAGYTTSLMLFAENKFSSAEGIDWSYWPTGNIQSSESINIFKQFQSDTLKNGFSLNIYDS